MYNWLSRFETRGYDYHPSGPPLASEPKPLYDGVADIYYRGPHSLDRARMQNLPARHDQQQLIAGHTDRLLANYFLRSVSGANPPPTGANWKLPPEILCRMFLHAVGNPTNAEDAFPFPLYVLKNLTRVCRSWRAAALSDPNLWSFVECRFNPLRGLKSFSLLLDKSNQSALHLCCYPGRMNDKTDWVKLLTPHLHRIHSVRMEFPEKRILAQQDISFPRILPEMTSLRLLHVLGTAIELVRMVTEQPILSNVESLIIRRGSLHFLQLRCPSLRRLDLSIWFFKWQLKQFLDIFPVLETLSLFKVDCRELTTSAATKRLRKLLVKDSGTTSLLIQSVPASCDFRELNVLSLVITSSSRKVFSPDQLDAGPNFPSLSTLNLKFIDNLTKDWETLLLRWFSRSKTLSTLSISCAVDNDFVTEPLETGRFLETMLCCDDSLPSLSNLHVEGSFARMWKLMFGFARRRSQPSPSMVHDRNEWSIDVRGFTEQGLVFHDLEEMEAACVELLGEDYDLDRVDEVLHALRRSRSTIFADFSDE